MEMNDNFDRKRVLRPQAESKRWGYVLVGILVEGQQAEPGHAYLLYAIFHWLFVYDGVPRKRVCEAAGRA